MAVPLDGSGASVTFGTSAYTAQILSINFDEVTRDALETSHLGTTGAESFIPADNWNPGGVTLEIQSNPNNTPPYTAVTETVTVTYPTGTGENNGPSLAASGFIDSWTPPNAERKSIITETVHVKFTGAITATTATT